MNCCAGPGPVPKPPCHLLFFGWTFRMPTLPGDSTLAGPQGIPLPGKSASKSTSKSASTGHAAGTRRAQARRPRRPIGSAVMHAPQVLRALVRADEIWLVVFAAFVGCGTGILVWLMTATTQLIHETLFGIAHTERLSAMASLNPLR